MEALFSLLILAAFASLIGGFIAIFTIPKQRQQLEELKRAFDTQQRKIESLQFMVDGLRTRSADVTDESANEAVIDAEQQPRESGTLEEQVAQLRSEETVDQDSEATVDAEFDQAPTALDRLSDNVKENWMIWLGGFCVALAGIYLVRYSIDQGLLGPTARIIGGLVLGGVLHATAEFLRRKTGDVHPSFAAMAGAGSITLYASLLAAMRLYDLVSPGTAFVGMAIVALATMAMSYIHGPVLAAFGILGAYLVPILVSTGSGQVNVALIYALIVSASALLLLRFVYRPWLWWGFLIGALGWWFITLGYGIADEFRPFYLTILAYMLIVIPRFDWLLQMRGTLSEETYRVQNLVELDQAQKYSLVAILLIIGALGVTILFTGDHGSPWFALVPLVVLTLIARTHEGFYWVPWLTFFVILGAWFVPQLVVEDQGWSIQRLEGGAELTFLYYLFVMSIASSGLSIWSYTTSRFRLVSSSLATAGPILALTVGYLLTSHLINSWHWGLSAALLALVYLVMATRSMQKAESASMVVWLFVAGHFGLALAAAMVFNAATLTVAIAVQMISVAWLIQKFDLPDLDWLLKLIVGTVVVRLTLNPWLVDYSPEIHWPLWTYGGSTLCAVVAIRLLKNYETVARWAEAAALHLFVLTIWAELRYQLYEGAVFAKEFTFTEAVINIALFGSLSIVYYRRSLVSATLQKLYVLFSCLLLVLALGSYLLIGIRTIVSDVWVYGAVGETAIFNPLLAAYGVPIILAYLFSVYHDPAHRKYALGMAGFFAFVFVSLQIRHLWEGTIRYDYPPTSPGELYSYSAVWLLMAIIAILGGAWRYGQQVYRAGMILLAVVIAKLFLIDMSDLEGLLRVASFMGLGLSLLGISFLYQKLQSQNTSD